MFKLNTQVIRSGQRVALRATLCLACALLLSTGAQAISWGNKQQWQDKGGIPNQGGDVLPGGSFHPTPAEIKAVLQTCKEKGYKGVDTPTDGAWSYFFKLSCDHYAKLGVRGLLGIP